MTSSWIAAAVALVAWWLSTGVILWRVRWADNGPEGGHLWSVMLGLPLLVAGVLGAQASVAMTGAAGAYAGFGAALALWGWIELAFLSGVITGPVTRPCPPRAPEWERFLRAFGTIAWHEIALVLGLFTLILLSRGAEHAFALWTFAVLFFARISAKLNLFFGVPRIHTDFLPRGLGHLPSHFRHREMNAFFPLSVTALTFAAGCWLERMWNAPDPGATVGFALLATLTVLALLEHWFMVLPLPDEKLWRWMLPAPKHQAMKPISEDANGF